MAQRGVQQPFLCTAPKSEDWAFFKKQFANYLIIVEATEAKKLPILLNCIGHDGYTIYEGLAEPKASYDEAVLRFDDFFKIRSSLLLRRKHFFEAKQGAHESVVEYSCRLRRLIGQCDFNAATSAILLRDIFVCGIYSNNLGEKLLSEDASTLTFDNAIARAEAWERARSDRQTVGTSQVVSNIIKKASARRCFRCNSDQHLANAPTCPGRTATCHGCGLKGHFKIVCRGQRKLTIQRKDETQVSTIAAHDSSTDAMDFTVFASGIVEDDMKRMVHINGQEVEVLIDTGAQVNILPQSCIRDLDMGPSAVKVSAWGDFPLEVAGETVCEVRYKDIAVRAKFVVVKLATRGNMPLFTAKLCSELRMLQELVSYVQQNVPSDRSTEIIAEFEAQGMFSGTGLLKNFAYKVKVDNSVKPVSSPPVKLPPAILEEVEGELRKLCSEQIIRKIEEPTSWCSRLVIAKKKSGDIRICTDLRALNLALKRPIFPMPDPADIFARIGKAKVYSLLDCRSAFHQIALDLESQPYFTFAAPSGRYMWQRMPMGAKIAPEVFQKALSDLLTDIPHTFVFYDDILIATKDAVAHAEVLSRVLRALLDNGLKLNKDKCVFEQDSIEFLGHSLSSAGIAPSLSKIQAILEIPEPESKEQMRSFLGLANFVGQKFVPNFAVLSAPLWRLCSKDAVFSWTGQIRECFASLCRAIGQATGTVWFDFRKDIVIQTDASADGLGCVLLQDAKPVAYASRKLTSCEKRYSVIEKEFLGIVFALKKFRRLLLFNKCQLFTDHKPIMGMLEKRLDSLPVRIQKWIVQIQAFDISFSYIAGERNVLADALSRNSLDSTSINQLGEDFELDEAEYTVCFILKSVPLDLRKIADATTRDPLLSRVVTAIDNSWSGPADRKILPFYGMRDQLSTKRCSREEDSDVVLKGELVVIPECLVEQILLQVHDGHLGCSKMKSLIQSYAYWPGFSKDVENFVERCSACAVYQSKADKAPLQSVASEAPKPYHTLAIDLCGPNDEAFNGHTLLTIIDLHSRYPEVYVLKRSNTTEVVNCLSHSFSRFGIPVKIISDNGPQFISNEFDKFVSQLGIVHSRSSNYFPSSNGCIERFHSTLKSRLKRIFYDQGHVEFEVALVKVLYDVRKTTNAMTGQTPFQLMFGRPMRTDLSRLTEGITVETSPRNISQEYERQSSRVVRYPVGCLVFYRMGVRKPFSGLGVVRRDVGNNAYEIKTEQGYTRIYNQSNLKPRFQDDKVELADEAYEYAAGQCNADECCALPAACPKSSPPAVCPKSLIGRYNLRNRYVDPKCYK